VHGLVRQLPSEAETLTAGLHHAYACNLLDEAGLKALVLKVQPQAVAHLAGIAFVAHGDVQAIYATNVVGTRNLLVALAALALPPASILLASSANVYGNSGAGELDEQTPPAPANDYAVSKLAMEYMAKTWMDKLPITLVRPFNYTGVWQSPDFLLPKIVNHFRDRAPVLELGNLDVERDISDVRMAVDAYTRLLEQPQPGQTFNVCSGQGYALRDILALASSLTGHQPEVRVNPAFVRANEVKRLVGRKAALEAAIGPVHPIALADTLRWMLACA
jgi:nucleoside-diphosphate-sugar epimerase